MTDDNIRQPEQDEALRLIEVQVEEGATMLESTQSAIEKASLLAKSQDAEQDEYGEAGRLIAAMYEQDKKRWRQEAGVVDERDEEQKKHFRNAKAAVNNWIEVTAGVLESISPELADRFLGLGASWLEGRTMRDRVINLERKLYEHCCRLLSIYKQIERAGVPEKVPQRPPAEDEEGKMAIFFAYAREDETLRDELEKHLRMLKREGVITSWHDRKIGAGKEWKGEIDTHLNTARVILLLISSDFIDSDYCWDVEVKRAMERHEAGEARVIPVILRSVDWKSAPFGKLQVLPTNVKPVTGWENRDEAFFDVAQGIRAAVMELRAEDNDSDPNHRKHNLPSAP